MCHMWSSVRGWLLVGFKNPVLFAPARSKKQQEATQQTPGASIRFFNRGRRIFLCLGLCRLLQCLRHAERDPIEPVDGHGPDEPYTGDANAVPETRPKFRVRGAMFFRRTLQIKRLFIWLRSILISCFECCYGWHACACKLKPAFISV